MKNYQDMNNEEIKEQLEWSDQHEFSYGYSMWAFKEIERLNNIINKAIEYIKRELLQEQVEYYKNNKYNVTISGKDIMAYEIIDLLNILEGSDKE